MIRPPAGAALRLLCAFVRFDAIDAVQHPHRMAQPDSCPARQVTLARIRFPRSTKQCRESLPILVSSINICSAYNSALHPESRTNSPESASHKRSGATSICPRSCSRFKALGIQVPQRCVQRSQVRTQLSVFWASRLSPCFHSRPCQDDALISAGASPQGRRQSPDEVCRARWPAAPPTPLADSERFERLQERGQIEVAPLRLCEADSGRIRS